MRTYPLKLGEYGLTRNEYMELYWFCRQYPEKKRKLATLIRAGSGLVDCQSHTNENTSPVETAVFKRELLLADCQMIEQATVEADRDLHFCILQNVAYGRSYENIKPPCGINQFTAARRKFFFILHEKKLSANLENQ